MKIGAVELFPVQKAAALDQSNTCCDLLSVAFVLVTEAEASLSTH